MERRSIYFLHNKTPSLWDYVVATKSRYLDEQYVYTSRTLYPSLNPKNIVLWHEFYNRFDSTYVNSNQSRDKTIEKLLKKNKEMTKKLMNLHEIEGFTPLKSEAQEIEKRKEDFFIGGIVTEIITKAILIVEENKLKKMQTNTQPPIWLRDDDIYHCRGCGIEVSFFTRKHHCRNCGEIFCNQCSLHKKPIPNLLQLNPVRICDGCNEHLEKIESRKNTKSFEINPNLLK